MKEKGLTSAFLTATILLSGCKSTPLNSVLGVTGEPLADDIYKGTIGYCQQSFDAITKNVGNSATRSPEERKLQKENAWKSWQEKKSQMKADVAGKTYSISHPAAFSRYNEETGLMELNLDGYTTGNQRNVHRENSAIPETIVLNTYDHWFSPTLPVGWGPSNWTNMNHKFALEESIALDKFGGSTRRNRDIYVINNYDNAPHYSERFAAYGGMSSYASNSRNQKIVPSKLMSVAFDTKEWFKNSQSPVLLKDGSFYLDTEKLDFVKVFGVYPDLGNPYIEIEYTFEFTGCSNGQLDAEVKEISLTSLRKGTEIYKATL